MANKKVLVVDGNFDHPTLTNASFNGVFLEDLLKDEEVVIPSAENNMIAVLANHGGDYSLLEKSSEIIISKKIDQLKKSFDVILIETQPLSLMNKAKEWIQFADKVIAVFEANQTLAQDKKTYLDYLRTLGSKFVGLVLNKAVIHKKLEVKQV